MTYRLLSLQNQLISRSQQPIQTYRKTGTIDIKQFKQIAFGPNYQYRDQFFDLAKKNPQIFPHYHLNQFTRQQKRQIVLKQLLFYSKNQPLKYENYLTNPNAFSIIGNAQIIVNPSFNIVFVVQFFLYHKTLLCLGTKFHQKFLHRAATYKDIGCFGLTEFNHGSNVKGILTEAHYDHQTKTFKIHSPNKDAMKFWIGGLANLANMAVIWAQLYIGGKCYGVHAYLVPIRDPNTHELLPGILIGDCGPKTGMEGIDNGFAMFDNVRIPKQYQLNRISGVDQNGKFVSIVQKQQKRFGLQLNPLSGGRVAIPFIGCSLQLTAEAIAIRYVLSRRQFSAPKSDQQILLYEYPLTKYRLIPLLSQTVAFLFACQQLQYQWDSNIENLLDVNNKYIQQLHAISSILKPKVSWFSSKVVSECRQMLGGHGYSSLSRLGALYNDNDVNLTWEGDNNVLLQQTAKYVLDNARKYANGDSKIDDSALLFLNKQLKIGQITFDNLRSIQFLENLIQYRLAKKLQKSMNKLMELKSQGLSDFDVWNKAQMHYLAPMAQLYGDNYIIKSAKITLKKLKNENNKRVFSDCVKLWILKTLEVEGFGQDQTKKLINQAIRQYIDLISKQAVLILDSLAPPFQAIGSPFADEHGNGMKRYLNNLYSAKDTFSKKEWHKLQVE